LVAADLGPLLLLGAFQHVGRGALEEAAPHPLHVVPGGLEEGVLEEVLSEGHGNSGLRHLDL